MIIYQKNKRHKKISDLIHEKQKKQNETKNKIVKDIYKKLLENSNDSLSKERQKLITEAKIYDRDYIDQLIKDIRKKVKSSYRTNNMEM